VNLFSILFTGLLILIELGTNIKTEIIFVKAGYGEIVLPESRVWVNLEIKKSAVKADFF